MLYRSLMSRETVEYCVCQILYHMLIADLLLLFHDCEIATETITLCVKNL